MRWRPLYNHQGLSPRGGGGAWAEKQEPGKSENGHHKAEGTGVGGPFLPSPFACSSRPCFFTPLFFAFRFPPSGSRFQVSAFQLFASYPDVGIEFGYGEKLVAGLFDLAFHPQPVEQRALGLLLAGCGSDKAPNETRSNRRLALFPL